MPSKVSLVKSTDHFAGTSEALEKVKDTFWPRLLASKNVAIKVNFVAAIRELATTPAASVEAFLDFIRTNGYQGTITIAETAVMGSAPLAFKMYGFTKMVEKYNAKLLDLRKDVSFPVTIVDEDGNDLSVPYSATLESSDFLVSMTRPKTHDTVVATLSIKNIAVGGLVRSRSSVHQGKMIHQNLVRVLKVRVPDLGVLDGVVGMQGNGPISGAPINSGWLAASTDLLALDTLGLHLMDIDLEDVGYLYMLKEEGFGTVYPSDQVDIIGEDPSTLVRPFKLHSSYEHQRNWR